MVDDKINSDLLKTDEFQIKLQDLLSTTVTAIALTVHDAGWCPMGMLMILKEIKIKHSIK